MFSHSSHPSNGSRQFNFCHSRHWMTSLLPTSSLFDLGDVCQKCKQGIDDAPCFEAAGFTWHASGCFTCSSCNEDISSSFVEKYTRVFCIDCDKTLFGSYCGEKLGSHQRDSGCGHVIQGEYLLVNDCQYHPSCLECGVCKGVSESGAYFMVENILHCARCAQP